MKWIVGLLVCAAAVWFVWTQHPEILPPALVSEIQAHIPGNSTTETSKPVLLSTPVPQGMTEVRDIRQQQPATEKLQPMAEGTYCMLERISITTDSGVIGIPPGTMVRRLKGHGSAIDVTDGTNLFSVKLSQVTTDPETAGRLAQAEKQKSASLAAWQQAQMQSAQAGKDAHEVALAKIMAARAMQDRYSASTLWRTEYLGALEEARVQHKKLLIDFTGSDWCKWCMKMEQDTLSKPEFINYAAKNLVLLRLDYPNHLIQPEDIKRQNKELATQFHPNGYPTFVLLDGSGKELGRMSGYYEGGPAVFTSMLDRFK